MAKVATWINYETDRPHPQFNLGMRPVAEDGTFRPRPGHPALGTSLSRAGILDEDQNLSHEVHTGHDACACVAQIRKCQKGPSPTAPLWESRDRSGALAILARGPAFLPFLGELLKADAIAYRDTFGVAVALRGPAPDLVGSRNDIVRYVLLGLPVF